jgi:hypothetical protein
LSLGGQFGDGLVAGVVVMAIGMKSLNGAVDVPILVSVVRGDIGRE